ncbi:TMEM143 family protein [Leptothoe kymatousa]|uniref:DUF3754 domain-containing protein n=1 Tax=Leptothoe kymatousa TAU-MAC 1615 TaxID=2364775 RepID=A0ABS5Y6M9_9CYAN|nr:TMEM143 family protein [Leptothoe kymatousa]MBT9313519.1 DUF3754 domain-containing protein [Leptothoe kymatousa TAU-MAC 1615]
MTTDPPREAFIPYPRKDIIKLCLSDGHLTDETAKEFAAFCEILTAFYHFKFHSTLDTIKENYRVFNPNAEIQPLYETSLQDYEAMGRSLMQAFKRTLDQANYYPVPEATIQQALNSRTLINLKTDVDFNDFEQVLCYCRGDINQTIKTKKFFFWEAEQTVDILERLVLLIQFKGERYFQAKEKQTKRKRGQAERKFVPGKMYVYFYKNIPKFDLDLLFPNVKTSMTLRDQLMLAVPAIGAAIPVLLKALPNILILVAAILLTLNAGSALESIDVEEEQARNIMPVLVATLTFVIALGGFGVKQYSQYKNKKIKFQKDVTDTLFFNNLANNASVFQMLVDIAEEEECKEIILVYYHLLTSAEPLTPQALDAKVEKWMVEKTGTAINFDIAGPLKNLQGLRGYVGGVEKPLMDYDDQGRCRLLSLKDSMAVLDYLWDNAFDYSEG